jgi:hypothetical protein
MTQTLPESNQAPPRRKTSRAPVAILLVISLIASAITRDWAIDRRTLVDSKDRGSLSVNSDTSLNSMPSFATALLLGGLRGPLVMILWTSSESQKQENDLQDIDTKIEWIRLLQPEFDAVHLFQIWNKAYNLSVKMTSLNNKYACIIDALDYARRVDAQRPDDINIISTVALTYADKLGTSTESPYYKHRIRRETQTLWRVSFPISREDEFRAAASKLGWIEEESPISTNPTTQTAVVLLEKPMADHLATVFPGNDVQIRPQERAKPGSEAMSSLHLPRMLDVNGNILPELLAPTYPRPADLPPDQPWYDGSRLQMLAPYQPFPYGLSTLALAYNDYKRSQLLQSLWNERPMQLSGLVVDSRPGIMLKQWGQDEWERGRRYELRALGAPPVPATVEPSSMEQMDAGAPPTATLTDQVSRDAAIYSYTLAAHLFVDSRKELERFISDYPSTVNNYLSHVDDTIAMEQLMLADRDYLLAISATGQQRDALLQSAAVEYDRAERQFALIVLKYWTDDKVAANSYPINPATHQRYNRYTIDAADPSLFVPTYVATMREARRLFTDPRTGEYIPSNDMYYQNRAEYLEYIARCQIRLLVLQAATKPSTQPAPMTNP